MQEKEKTLLYNYNNRNIYKLVIHKIFMETNIPNPKEKNVRLDPNSEVWVEQVKRYTREDGTMVKQKEWIKLKEPLNLGSLKNPKTEIEGMEVRDTSPPRLNIPWFHGL